MDEDITRGLLGCGLYGEWRVEIDEIEKGAETLYGAVIYDGKIWLQFNIENLSILTNIVSFIRSENPSEYIIDNCLDGTLFSEYTIDNCLGGSLNWFFDEGRLCIQQVTEGKLGQTEQFKVMLSEEEWKDLTVAIEDALDDAHEDSFLDS